MNHREQALDGFFISWENEESGNFLRKWGKWVFFCSSPLCCRSTFQPLIQQHLRSWCQCYLLLHLALDVWLLPRGSSILEDASLQEEVSWSPAPWLLSLQRLSAKDCLEARQHCPLISQPAAWQETVKTPLGSWIPMCSLPWKHGRKQRTVSRIFLYLLSWKVTALSFWHKLTKSMAKESVKYIQVSGREALRPWY